MNTHLPGRGEKEYAGHRKSTVHNNHTEERKMKTMKTRKAIRLVLAGTLAAAMIAGATGCASNALASPNEDADEIAVIRELSETFERSGAPGLCGQMLPGMNGQMPAMDGQMPQMDGQFPNMDGQMPGVDGQMPPQMDGQMPGMDGQTPPQMNGQMPPQMDGQMPDMDGQTPPQMNGQMPDMDGQAFPEMGEELPDMNGQVPGMDGQMPPQMNGQFPNMDGQTPGMDGRTLPDMNGNGSISGSVSSALPIAESDVECTADDLEEDTQNAVTIVMSEENSQLKIDEAGTYIVTGTCPDGNITVKKGTTGVVLVLQDLDLTSTTGAAVSLNKYSEVKLVIRGDVKLTDHEDPADEDSADADVADAFDGAALKIKDGANVYLTGTGTLTIDAASCKNGIKSGDEEGTCFVIDGTLTLSITAANDGINGGYDVTILNGTVIVDAEDDGIHADRILTIGNADGTGPDIRILDSKEGLEGTVVNLFGGTGSIKASDDGINAANSDYTFADTLTFSDNITGGTWNVTAGTDGIDSNGNVNLTGGHTAIRSADNGGDAGIDYDGSLYVADNTLTNTSGVSGPDGMGGFGQNRGFGR